MGIYNEYSNFTMKSGEFTWENQVQLSIMSDNKSRGLCTVLNNHTEEALLDIQDFIRDFMPNKNNNFSILYNYRMMTTPPKDRLPKLVSFDLDRTLFYNQHTPHDEYFWSPDIGNIVAFVRLLKNNGVKTAIISRHTKGQDFKDFLFNDQEEVPKDLFDYMVVKYAGDPREVHGEIQDAFISPDDPDSSKFWYKNTKSKHLELVKKFYMKETKNVIFDQEIVVFDDQEDPIPESSVFKALSPNYNRRSKSTSWLTATMVKEAMCIYAFKDGLLDNI